MQKFKFQKTNGIIITLRLLEIDNRQNNTFVIVI